MKKVRRKKNNISSQKFVHTGSTTLDLALGGGGVFGKILNIVGDFSSGKSLLASEIIAKARSIFGEKLKWKYNDAEAGYSFDSKKIYGFEIIKPNDNISTTLEDFGFDFKRELNELKNDEYLIYVLDSLDSLTSEAEIKRSKDRQKATEQGKSFDKGSYNLEKQKSLGEFFRLRRKEIKDKNCLLIVISQVRMNINVMFGSKYYRTGGKALDHYSSQIIWLAVVEEYKKKGRAIGISIKAKVKKNKIGKPFRECFIELLFDYGIDDITGNIIFLYNLKTPKGKIKKAEKLKWKENEYSLAKLVDYIEENNEKKELEQAVIQKWDEIEESISPKRKAKYD